MLAKTSRSIAAALAMGAIAFANCDISVASENIWDELIATPSESSFRKCRTQVARSIEFLSGFRPSAHPPEPRYFDEYWQFLLASPGRMETETARDLVLDDRRFDAFLNLVRQGDRRAIDLGFLLYPMSDGGITHDLNVALGMTIHDHPDEFLASFAEHWGLVIDPGALATSMDDELIEDLAKQLQEIEDRLAAIGPVSGEYGAEAKEFILGQLRASRDGLELLLGTRKD